MNSLKEKVRKEWTPAPVMHIVKNMISLVFIFGTLFLVVTFGWKVGAVFAVTLLGFSIFAGWKWNF